MDSQEDISEPTKSDEGEDYPDGQEEIHPMSESIPQAYEPDIYRGYVQLCYKNGQSYYDLGHDPNEDSSWSEDMIKPFEEDERTTIYPMQGANWGNVR